MAEVKQNVKKKENNLKRQH